MVTTWPPTSARTRPAPSATVPRHARGPLRAARALSVVPPCRRPVRGVLGRGAGPRALPVSRRTSHRRTSKTSFATWRSRRTPARGPARLRGSRRPQRRGARPPVADADRARARGDRDRLASSGARDGAHAAGHRGPVPRGALRVRRRSATGASNGSAMRAMRPRAPPRCVFGFRYEGLFRQHMWIKGRNRDTAWFGMTDGDWAATARAYRPGSTRRTSTRRAGSAAARGLHRRRRRPRRRARPDAWR